MTQIKFSELKKLHRSGFALHWLRPKSKMPLESGWTKGPRLEWEEFKSKYRDGLNVGVRLGKASQLKKGFLAVIDLDVKSKEPKHAKEAWAALCELFPKISFPISVQSGRGNGSAHFYVTVPAPISGAECKAKSAEVVKVKMPSVSPSKKELETLSPEEIAQGLRLRHAWEISLLSEGRQVVLPGSIHPDSGKPYVWGIHGPEELEDRVAKLPQITSIETKRDMSSALKSNSDPKPTPAKGAREFVAVDVKSLGLRVDQIAAIESGAGVEDRSATCFALCMALVQRKIPDIKIISLLTDRTHWLSRTAFDHAKTEDRNRAALWLEKYCLKKAKEKVETSAFDHEVVEEKESKKESKANTKDLPATGRSWLDDSLEWQREFDFQSAGRGAPPVLRPTFKNVRLILENEFSPNLLKRNTFHESETWTIKTPWGYKPGRKRSGGMDDALFVKDWLIKNYELECSLTLIDEALTGIAIANKFHPVKDLLESIEWDGVDRIDTAFKRYLGAEMPEPYLSDVTRKFFLALIQRIYEPGCKFDHVVIFEGKQGVGKSTFGRILVGAEFFLDGLPDLKDKDAALNLQGAWLVEMGELSTLYRSELELAKAFIVRETDKVRPPYGRRREDYPRSSIFYGTTNDEEYLIDPTGNRRFWPVAVKGCDFKALKRDRLQILAEAKWLYDFCREPLYLTGKAKLQAEKIQRERKIDDDGDSMKSAFIDWLNTPAEERLGAVIDLKQIRLDDLFEGPWARLKLNKNTATRKIAARLLREMGYHRAHTKTGKLWKPLKG